jgi:hypothetical protein
MLLRTRPCRTAPDGTHPGDVTLDRRAEVVWHFSPVPAGSTLAPGASKRILGRRTWIGRIMYMARRHAQRE